MKLDHIFFDCVAGSGDPLKDPVSSLAAIRTDRKGKLLAAYSSEVAWKPEDSGAPISYVEGKLKDALITPFPEKYIVIALGVDSKKPHLHPDTFAGRMWLDSFQVAWPLYHNGLIASRSLDAFAKYHGVDTSDLDSVTGRVEILAKSYWIMMRRLSGAIMVSEKAIELGQSSPVTKGVLRLLGLSS